MGDRSPFRTGFLKVALFINGAWVAVAMTELGDDGVTFRRGARPGAQQSEVSALTFTLKDPTGKWNNRHPASQYYGLIGRSTPVRVQVEMTAGVTKDLYYGEVVSWQPSWTKTGSKDSYVEVEAAGSLRQIGQGFRVLKSPMRRSSEALPNLVAYWPLEEQATAKKFSRASYHVSSRFQGLAAGIPVHASISPAIYTGFAASNPLPTLQGGSIKATIPTYVSAGGLLQVRWLTNIPASTPNLSMLATLDFGGGTLDRMEVTYETGGNIGIKTYNTSGAVVSDDLLAVAIDNKKIRTSIQLDQNGANIDFTFAFVYEANPGTGASVSYSLPSVTLGALNRVWFNPKGAALGEMPVGHLTVENTITTVFDLQEELDAYRGETALNRFLRLTGEADLTVSTKGTGSSILMGAQAGRDLFTCLREVEASDGGLLYEPRDSLTNKLEYRLRTDLCAQTPVTIPYSDNLLVPFVPVEDDEATVNRMTVVRENGASHQVSEPDGPLGTATIGIYESQATLSLNDDDDAFDQATWRLHLGQVNEARWPQIGLDLAHPTFLSNVYLRNAILDLDLGDRLDVTDPPDWLPPFRVSQIIVGYAVQITPLNFRIVFNCTPARPYNIVRWDTGGNRWSGEGTVLTAAITSKTATTFTVTPPAGVTWTHADGDYDVLINGEQMTVKDVVGNLFTVVRAVNGISKTHLINSAVALAEPAYYGF